MHSCHGAGLVQGDADTMATFASIRLCSLPSCILPCFEDTTAGNSYSYCSREHANEALAQTKWASLCGRGGRVPPPPQQCQLDGCSLTVHIDDHTGRIHNFCGRRHADLALAYRRRPSSPSRPGAADAAAAPEAPAPASKGTAECKVQGCQELVYRDPVTKNESNYCSNRHYVMGTALLNRECIRDECHRTAWVDEDTGDVLDYCGSRCAGRVGLRHLVGVLECSLPGCVNTNMVHPRTRQEMGYCCEDHRLRATQRWLGPNPEPFIDRTFRGGTTSADDFQLSVLTNRHPEYLSRKQHFMEKWVKPTQGTGVSVLRIFKIKVPEDIRRRAERHMGKVGNVKRRFHGTSCSDVCTFFVDLRGGPCGEASCKVCNICTHGFRLRENVGATARRTNFDLRYGEGLYFSSFSGKANDYAEFSEKTDRSGKKVRCMFLASVSLGRPFTTLQGKLDPAAGMCPPPGFDSVIGEPGPNLNYPEDVVYKEEAAIPTHLCVYALHE